MTSAIRNRKNIGIIGLGIIGSRVAAALRSNGFHPFVWSRTPKPTPNFLGSAAEVAEICETIQLFLPDATATLGVIDLITPLLNAHHIVLSHGTIGLEATLEAARRVKQTGAGFLDAPFTGSKLAAEKRQLTYYIGGDKELIENVRPALNATSKAIIHCGAIGQAAVLKIATNLVSATTVQVLAEALALVRASGIPPESLQEAIEQNAIRSGTTDLKLPKMLSEDYEPHFSLKHMFKDVQLGLQLANKLQLDLPSTSSVAGSLYHGIQRGWGELDFAALAKAFEQAAK